MHTLVLVSNPHTLTIVTHSKIVFSCFLAVLGSPMQFLNFVYSILEVIFYSVFRQFFVNIE
jgi:hypothetical protein